MTYLKKLVDKRALEHLKKKGEKLVPGSITDNLNAETNICKFGSSSTFALILFERQSRTVLSFLRCRHPDINFSGAGFFRDEPKRMIFLCQEQFDYEMRQGDFKNVEQTLTHEMIHWIDSVEGKKLDDTEALFKSELRAATLSGQCLDGYSGENELFKKIFNHSLGF
jgi:hypothetical protein